MERVPSWLMWNLPLSVIWIPSCCTMKRQKTGQGQKTVESSPPSRLFSKAAEGCDEPMWPADVSIALSEEPESHPRTAAPAWTHGKEVPAQPPAHPRRSLQGMDTPHVCLHFLGTAWLERVLCPDAVTEVSRHRILKVFGQGTT